MTIKPVLVPDHDAADLRDLMNRFSTAAQSATPAAQANRIRQQLQESRPDVMRHRGDKTIKIVKRAGKPIGEIGTDAEASEGNGQYYVKLYDGSYDAVGYDTAEEALAELKYAVKQMAEGSLTEFAPSDSGGGGDDDGFDEDTLRKLAAQWFAGDEDPQVERLLAAAGWEIGQDEGYDDEPGVFVVMSGDDDGRSYISWPAEELRSAMSEGVTEAAGMYGDEEVSWEEGGRRAPTGAFRNPAVVKTNKSIGTRVSDIGAGGKEYNVKTDKEWDKQSGMAEAEAKGPFARVKTETLQQFWDSHKDEQNPAPVLADKLKRIRQELVRRKRADVTEGTGAENNPVVNAITRRIMLQRTDLLSKYGPEKVVQAVDEVADFVGDVEEIGSSDVSGWIRHVEQMLGNMEPGVTEDEVEEGWKSKLAAAGLAGAAALGGYAAGSSSPGTGFSNTKGIDQFNKPTAAQVQPSQTRNTGSGFSNTKGIDQFNKPTAAQGQTLRTQADLDAYNKTRPPGTSKLVNLPKDFEEDIAESVDPIEQLRADILRFAR